MSGSETPHRPFFMDQRKLTDDNLENLERSATSPAQQRYVYIPVDGRNRPVGEHHHRARLSDKEVEEIRDMREVEDGPVPTYHQIAEAMKAKGVRISKSTVAMVCRYERRASTPADWSKRPEGWRKKSNHV
jgi:hypothetical protein